MNNSIHIDRAPSRRRTALIRLMFNYSSTLFAVINGIILVPLYLHYFDLSTYGAWLASGNVIAILGLLDAGLTTVVAQQLAHHYGAKNLNRFAQTAGAGIVMFVLICGIMTILSLSFAHLIPPKVNADPSQYAPLALGFKIAGIGAALSLARMAVHSVAGAWQRPIFVGIASILALIGGVTAILVGLWTGWGVAALGLGVLVRGIIGFSLTLTYVAFIWSNLRIPKPAFHWGEIKSLLQTTAPLFVGRTSAVLLANSESLIVAVFLNPQLAAILALTGRAFSLAHMVINPIQSAVAAGMAHLSGDKPRTYQYSVVKEVFVLISIAIAMVAGPTLVLNQTFVSLWVGPSRFGGILLNAAICLATVSLSQAQLVGMIMTSLGELKNAGWITLIDAGLRLIFIICLLPWIKILGMPLAAFVATTCTFFLWLRLLKRYFSLGQKDCFHFVLSAWVPMLLILPVSFVLSWLEPQAKTWFTFFGYSTIAAFAASIIAYSSNGLFRDKVNRFLNIIAPI
ncbi:MAG: polysaccharide biosynthesis C-terminal domain-containing protein [Pseudomonadota bacterium]